MPRAHAERARRVVADEHDEALRGVIHYGEETGVVAVREDVDDRYTAGEIDDLVEDVKLEALMKTPGESLVDAGPLSCFVRVFEEAYLLNYPLSESCGVMVGVDRPVQTSLDALVRDIEDALQD